MLVVAELGGALAVLGRAIDERSFPGSGVFGHSEQRVF